MRKLKRNLGTVLLVLGISMMLISYALVQAFVWPLYKVQTPESYRQIEALKDLIGNIGAPGLVVATIGACLTPIQIALRFLRSRTNKQ